MTHAAEEVPVDRAIVCEEAQPPAAYTVRREARRELPARRSEREGVGVHESELAKCDEIGPEATLRVLCLQERVRRRSHPRSVAESAEVRENAVRAAEPLELRSQVTTVRTVGGSPLQPTVDADGHRQSPAPLKGQEGLPLLLYGRATPTRLSQAGADHREVPQPLCPVRDPGQQDVPEPLRVHVEPQRVRGARVSFEIRERGPIDAPDLGRVGNGR